MRTRRLKQALVYTLLAMFVLGSYIPAANAATTRTVDVTVKPRNADFWDWLAFNQGFTKLNYLKNITVTVLVGGMKEQEATLDKNNREVRFNFTTDKIGDIKTKVVYNYETYLWYQEYISKVIDYTKPGQIITFGYYENHKLKVLKLP